MLETLSVRPRICEQIRSGPLGQWIDDFVDVLTTRGYETSVMRRHVRAAAIFSAWLDRQRVAATEIDEPLVTRFISGLPRWRAPKRRHGRVSNVAGGVRLLAAHLRTRGVAPHPGPVADRCETEQWLQRYDDHLVQVHGLVVGTRRIYRRYAAALLGWRAYFGYCQTPTVLRRLGAWIRRRLRAVVWKQWQRTGTRFRELRKRGVNAKDAILTARSNRGPWRVTRTAALCWALPGAYFASLGIAAS